MANRQLVFPIGKTAERDAYADWADGQWKTITGNPQAIWTYRRSDGLGQPYCAYLGPPAEYPVGTPLAEPEGGEAMRANGVIVDAVVPVSEIE
jgi:hypothetical protein